MDLKAKFAALKAAPQLLHDPALAIRVVGIAGLLLLLVFLGRTMVLTWQQDPLAAAQKKQPPPASSGELPAIPEVRFYPPPRTPTDLHKGYLFNAERSLANPEAGKDGATDGPGLTELSYVGSVIVGTQRTALLAYSGSGPIPGQRPGSLKPGSRQQHLRVAEGENVGGYTVDSVLPDKIIFRQGERVVEKLLHEPNKKRLAPPSLPVAKAPAETNPAAPAAGSAPAENSATPPAGSTPAVPPQADATTQAGSTTATPPPPRVRVPGKWGGRLPVPKRPLPERMPQLGIPAPTAAKPPIPVQPAPGQPPP